MTSPTVAGSTATSPALAGTAGKTATTGEPALGFTWFPGSYDEALAAARTQSRPLFVYWGAIWCPPCRALNAEVFPQPRFAERMRAFIPVHLDGDAPEAQQLADRLGVASYPTMLVLDADGNERMRILGAAELDEVDAALAAAQAQSGSLRERIARALAAPASITDEDWALISLTTWADPTLPPPGGLAPVLSTVKQLTERVPAGHPEVAARLAGALLSLAGAEPPASDAAHQKIRAEIADGCPHTLDLLLADERTSLAGRAAILESPAEIASLCAKSAGAGLDDRLVRAARLLGAREELPVESRLEALGVETALWKRAHPGMPTPAPVPEPLRAQIQTRVRELLARPIADALRHTTLTTAADVLHDAGDDAGARKLLTDELARSRVPWYLQGELAAIAAARGEADEALRYSAAAVRSAEGRATQIQWRVEELKTLLKVHANAPDVELLPRLRSTYALIASLPDGFAGRNRRRLGMIVKALGPVAARPSVRAILSAERARCASLDEPRRVACQTHFDAFPKSPGG